MFAMFSFASKWQVGITIICGLTEDKFPKELIEEKASLQSRTYIIKSNNRYYTHLERPTINNSH